MNTPVKRCTKCNRELPATTEYFHQHKPSVDNLHPRCKDCANASRKQSYQRHRDTIIEKNLDYYETHREEQRERQRDYRKRNKQTIRQTRQQWCDKNREQMREYHRAYNKEWRDKNRGKLRIVWRLNQFLRRVTGQITEQDVERQYDMQEGLCYWCSNPVGEKYHIDHFIPMSRNGKNVPENIVIACSTCNWSKGKKLPYTEWQPPNPLFPPTGQ